MGRGRKPQGLRLQHPRRLARAWTAGSLASNATVEGIATNGTDVWILDAKSDTVYRYSGAASRLSGSQNASGSFSLTSGNKGPKDIVTDGVHVWVVNDNSTGKVFQYTLGGSLVGSWTITGGSGQPTGITIDPGNVSDIWIVDSSADKVFQYTAAASRISGSQPASASFALAPGNTNPQGIADPPPTGTAEPASNTPSHTESINPGTHDVALSQIVNMISRPQSVDAAPVSRGKLGRLPERLLRYNPAVAPTSATLTPGASPTRAQAAAEPGELPLDRILAEWDGDELLSLHI